MEEKLQALVSRFEELTHLLYDPALPSRSEEYRAVMQEHAQLEPLAEAYARREQAAAAMHESQQLLEEAGGDAELKELAQQEWREGKTLYEELTATLRTLLLPKDPNDGRNVIVEIRAGAGGEESALFAASLYRMYTMFAASRGYTVEPISENATELGGYREIVFMIAGHDAYSQLKFESGVHRVQRVPVTETGGRIHTSTVTVAVLPEAEEVELEIDPGDLQIDTYRASGAGGQHINKTESAIRITHLPTGTVVECQDERSQYKNKDKAMRVLRSRLLEQKQAAQRSAIAADRKAQVGTGDRSERIRTYNFPQGRVTDHRIGLTLYKIEAIMNGDITELIEALLTAQRTQQLQEGGED